MKTIVMQVHDIFGVKTPHEALQATRAYRMDDVSSRVTRNVLLLARAADHCVPLEQLSTRARTTVDIDALTAALESRGHILY